MMKAGTPASQGRRAPALLPVLALAVLLPGLPRPLHASDNVYTIANYPIEARAENAVAAKEKALADGQQAAFRSLLKRLVPVTAFAQARRLSSIKGADLIEGVKVPAGEVYHAVEGANGELGFYLVSDGSGRPYRVRVRPPCFLGMSALAEMLRGYMIADIVSTFGMINMIGGECDR